jgi:catechol 2,3-dioxygenase-like lactoylglutathione lyase family enzyme/predicted enzyme related to lactoylglutathione lyase
MKPRILPAISLYLSSSLLLCLSALPAAAQLAAPNAAGVSMGHMHLAVRDVDANKAFFVLLGGTPVQNGPLQLIQFPNMYVMLRKGEPTGGSVGSTVNHFGFQVRDMNEWLPKWKAAGLKMEPITRPTQVYLITPDDIRVEILEDKALKTSVAGHHIHFDLDTAAIPEMQAWYVKNFGAVAGKRGAFEAADLPGINLTFTKQAPGPIVPTKGRSVDHIGFEVKNLPAFITKLEASGIKMDRAYAKVPNSTVGIAFLTDPWGTYIELTEGLSPVN